MLVGEYNKWQRQAFEDRLTLVGAPHAGARLASR